MNINNLLNNETGIMDYEEAVAVFKEEKESGSTDLDLYLWLDGQYTYSATDY